MPTIENNKDDQFSLEDTNTSGFHFDTPPGVSLESEIQPCGINGNSTHRTGSEEPSSLDSKSLEVSSDLLSETTTSSEYKVLTEVSSISTETNTKNEEGPKEILQVDSSTEDQMSSGTFSIDDNSPRYAELPAKLKNIRVPEESDAEDEHVKLTSSRKMSEKLVSMGTRSTSIASDVSDQEIPPTTPRSDLASPTSDAGKFPYGEKIEKFSNDTVDIMTQSIYLSSDEKNETVDVQSQANGIAESLVKTSENIAAAVLGTQIGKEKDEEKNETQAENKKIHSDIEKKESVEGSKNVVNELNGNTKEVIETSDLKDKVQDMKEDKNDDEPEKMNKDYQKLIPDTSSEKKKDLNETSTSTSSLDDTLNPSDDKSISDITTATSSSVILEKIDEKESVNGDKTVKSELSDNHTKKKDEETTKLESTKQDASSPAAAAAVNDKVEDPIAGWGKPLGLPSPIRPGTPAKHSKKNDDEVVDTNKVTLAYNQFDALNDKILFYINNFSYFFK